jgi:predicted  nucleic acid-binding Zn-ribbon protein
MAEPESEQAESRTLEIALGELQCRLDDASDALERLKVQQATFSPLLSQFQSDHNAALALCRELKELVEQKAEEPPGVVATLQAAVDKTRETVAGQVEHVRERAVAAFHRIKGDSDNPSEDGGRADDRH